LLAGVPSEVAIAGVYFPPLFFIVILAIALTMLTAGVLNRVKLSKYFFYPPLVFVALVIIFTGFINYSGLLKAVYAG